MGVLFLPHNSPLFESISLANAWEEFLPKLALTLRKMLTAPDEPRVYVDVTGSCLLQMSSQYVKATSAGLCRSLSLYNYRQV